MSTEIVERVWAHGTRATRAEVVRVLAARAAHLDKVEISTLVSGYVHALGVGVRPEARLSTEGEVCHGRVHEDDA